jgi:hypothetical protein
MSQDNSAVEYFNSTTEEGHPGVQLRDGLMFDNSGGPIANIAHRSLLLTDTRIVLFMFIWPFVLSIVNSMAFRYTETKMPSDLPMQINKFDHMKTKN